MNRAINAPRRRAPGKWDFPKREFNKVPGYYDRIANFRDKEADRRARYGQLLARRKGKYFSFPFSVRARLSKFLSRAKALICEKNDDTGSSAATLADDGLRSLASVFASLEERLTFIAKLRYHLAFIKPSSVFGEYSSVSLCQCHIVPSW